MRRRLVELIASLDVLIHLLIRAKLVIIDDWVDDTSLCFTDSLGA